MKKVTPQEAKALQDQGWTYVDVRSEPEFTSGHPAGAVNVPLLHAGPGGMSPNPDFLAVMLGNFPKDAKLVLGCMAGKRSANAGALLESNGYGSLADQAAGWGGPGGKGWCGSGLPEGSGAPAGKSYADLSKKKA
ncbi:MAG: rhodanese-like domain-containing protein [Myxococcaceae bacterium]|nr:rhodanese-like domain-containing protein [Myxococcaceae bacterium]